MALKYAKAVDGQECVLRVNPEVARSFKSLETHYLEELEEILGRPVAVISDPLLHQEKFDLT
jgi:ribonuclease G